MTHTQHPTTMTDSLGRPIADDRNTQTIGRDGPALLQDVHFIDKLAHFDRERVPERVVHAKGAGAFGEFECFGNFSRYTCASIFSRRGKRTRAFVRFSTVIGSKGSADTVRDPRGFAVKFYTDQGIYDIVGNDLPVFFIRDAIQFPDVIHALKPDPVTNLRNAERFWDFASLTPEITHMITWLYSDRGTIKSFRHVDGFGVNTYVWVTREGQRKLIKYHWKTMQGVQTIDRHEAERLSGSDPDCAVNDLREAIAAGRCPKYTLCVQMMDFEDADGLPFDPLDDTKTWPEDTYPLYEIGVLTLNENPQNFFAQVEQSAFCPGNLVPGVELSADKMLQGRSFSYLDTQRHRIGPNFAQLPINASTAPVANNQRDGSMTIDINPEPINYSPNSLNGNSPRTNPDLQHPGPMFSGPVIRQAIEKTDDFTQAGERYRAMSPAEQDALADNIAVELFAVRRDISERVLGFFEQADPNFKHKVQQAMEQYSKACS